MVTYEHAPCAERHPPLPSYSVKHAASRTLTSLLAACEQHLPSGYLQHLQHITFTSSSQALADAPLFPCPMREQEATAAVRALEGIAAAAIANLRYGTQPRRISVDVSQVGSYLMSAYMTTLDAMDKGHPEVRHRIPDTDLNKAQSVLYRRLSANIYETKTPGEYYHIHGSLDATQTLVMLNLEPFRPDLDTHEDCVRIIGNAVRQFTTPELEGLNNAAQQAGAPVLTRTAFDQTPHGRALRNLAPFTLKPLEKVTGRVPFLAATANDSESLSQVLQGIRVIELCRVIAGPAIGRGLAAHGASVLKVTSPDLPDVPFFQLDVNTGKHTTPLRLRNVHHRAILDSLLATADVVIDGYRPGALDRLGYGSDRLRELARSRGKGIVYVAEDCFGGTGLPKSADAAWADRPGWQQIADCVTGVAWEQGWFMGLNEPVVPPFPMSDYGTGALGCVAALTGLYLRATRGGSWVGRTSLCQYDMFLMSLEPYPHEVQDWLRKTHDKKFFELRHSDSVDEVGKRALQSLKHVHPYLFKRDMMQRAWSDAFGGMVAWPKEALSLEGLRVGHVRTARPNGFDKPAWDNWEVEEEVIQG